MASGFAINPDDGVRIGWETFGSDDARRTIVFLPTWSIVHSRIWKLQVPYFAQHGFRVVTFDGRGNGRSDRPKSGYTTEHFVADLLAVLDTLDIHEALFVGFSAGARWGIQLAAEHPERVIRLALIAPAARFSESPENMVQFLEAPPNREGFNKYNAVHWREDYVDFLQWFFSEISNEPHSTKQIEDGVNWGLETNPEILIPTITERLTPRLRELAAAVRCPTLIIHGTNDTIIPIAVGREVHSIIPNSQLVEMQGNGHAPHTRDPVATNQLLHDFFGREVPAERTRTRAMSRPKRALFVSSPIGLGHAQRDVAIADELRQLVPGLEIDWLAQHPVTSVLSARGEHIHPLSCRLAGESPHIESQMSGEHELNVFQ
ncbi:MAG TPA: alpha/beta hydrolase, partial [Thermomicrobiales bacterium]|nr:alpha/beta hydrolase [Thermomicrobiales bacterium]